MYSSSDFERLFVKYNCEAKPSGISIQKFCMSNKVPYNLFEKWYKDTRHKVVPVQIENAPSADVSKSIIGEVPTPGGTMWSIVYLSITRRISMKWQRLSCPVLMVEA